MNSQFRSDLKALEFLAGGGEMGERMRACDRPPHLSRQVGNALATPAYAALPQIDLRIIRSNPSNGQYLTIRFLSGCPVGFSQHV
jgi:hypothetical protein